MGLGLAVENVLIGNVWASTCGMVCSAMITWKAAMAITGSSGRVGTDALDGGIGTDTAVYAGDRATDTIMTSAGSIEIRDDDSVADGNDGTETSSAWKSWVQGRGDRRTRAHRTRSRWRRDRARRSGGQSGCFRLQRLGRCDPHRWIGSGEPCGVRSQRDGPSATRPS